MRDRFEEPFEFHVRTKGSSAPSRRPKESLRVGALVLALGVSTLCAVFWPSHSKKTQVDANAQTVATSNASAEEALGDDAGFAPRGSLEDIILNDRRSELDEVSALELADASFVDGEDAEEAISLAEDERFAAKNPVASTSYDERRDDGRIASSSFETQIEAQIDDEIDDETLDNVNDEAPDASTQIERANEEPVVKNDRRQSARSVKNSVEKSANADVPNAPGYFARAADLPGKHNSFSLRNFARAANLVDPADVYSPRSLTNAAQVDDLNDEAR